MKRERSKLIKLGLKSIFKHKIFAILMSVLVLVSGAIYTMLVSASGSFDQSHNNVTSNGNLHQYVIKENFRPSPASNLTIEILGSDNKKYIFNKENAKKYSNDLPGGKNGIITFKVTQKTGDYDVLDKSLLQKTIVFPKGDDSTFDSEWKKIETEYKSYGSSLDLYVEEHLSSSFIKELKKIYGDNILLNDNKSISVAFDKKAFNVVKYNQDTQVNKMFVYDGTEKFTSPLTKEELKKELKLRLEDANKDPNAHIIETLKEFKATARDSTGNAITLTDPSSYQAIISPAYANRNELESISVKWLSDKFNHDPNFMDKIINNSALKQKYKKNIVWVDKTPYFVIGIGTTPDYLYPIVDKQHPVIDVQNQAVIFVNNSGYKRILDGFRTNPKEEYISLRFKDGISIDRQEKVVSQIEHLIHSGKITFNKKVYITPKTGYPQDIKMVTSIEDKNDQLLLAQERIVFLNDLQGTINTVSYATTTLLVLFVAAVVILIFQLLISIDKKSLATQLALGYSKRKIAMAKTFASLVVTVVPILIGYLLGYLLQFWFMHQFDNYWTVPSYGTSFSLVTLLITVVAPTIGIWVLIYLTTWWMLRKPTTELLYGGESGGNEILTKIISGFKIVGVKSRYAVALTTRNIFKLSLVAVASTVSIGALTIGMSSAGKASTAYSRTINMNKYEFQVDLFSPTEEGGLYQTVNKGDLSTKYGLEDANILTPDWEPQSTYDALGNFKPNLQAGERGAHWHIPSVGDAKYGLPSSAGQPSNIKETSEYLHHKLQLKELLDNEVGGMNPWDIARRLMPDNQRNKADEDGEYINDLLGNQKSLNSYNVVKQILEDSKDQHVPYIISYGDVIVDKGDELYTYLSTRVGDDNYKIIGVQENTKMVNISDSIPKIKRYKGKNIPILVNHYISEYLNLSIGSKIKGNLLNSYKRYQKIHVPNKEVNFEIVGIVDGYDNKGIYTLQSLANKAIQMPKNGFNGVFTKQKDPSLLKTLPLYSPSGLWLGTDTVIGEWETVLENILKNHNIWDSKYSDHNSDNYIASSVSEFIERYSRTPFVGSTSSVQWNEISKYTFKNVSDLSTFIIQLVEIIAITLSIIFTIIIASLLLMSNRKKIATLWTMGYRKKEISLIFLTTYILPLTLATLIAIPISIAILQAMKAFVMGFGNVLIPFALIWWAPLVAIGVTGIIFVLATLFTIASQKPSKALESFKNE